jgi:hypothetical protein
MEINYLAVLASGIASMIIGSLWYGPLFGKQWMTMTKISPESMAEGKKSMAVSYVIMFVGSLVTASVFAWILYTIGEVSVQAGVGAGFWLWLGFVAPMMLGQVLWESKPWKLYFINSIYYLVLLLVIGMIVGGWN